MKLVNLTPHAVIIRTQGGGELYVAPSGTVARVDEAREPSQPITTYDGLTIATSSVVYGEITGLPTLWGPEKDAVYIVSGIVLERLRAYSQQWKERFASPGPLIRDDKGQPVACDGLTVL